MPENNKHITPFPKGSGKLDFIYGIADNSLILAQRLSELTGHGPALEVDMALSNIALDLFGEVRNYFQYGAQLAGEGKTEDDLAFFRSEREFRNVLLVELPNTDFAYVIARQFLYDHFHYLVLEELMNSADEDIAAVAAKSIKEVDYHKDFSSEWMKRLGDGTQESHDRLQAAVNDLWKYTDEFFQMTKADENMLKEGVGVNLEELREPWKKNVSEVLREATIEIPEVQFYQRGGKDGVHTEHMGHLLTEMQYLQRTYPGLEW